MTTTYFRPRIPFKLSDDDDVKQGESSRIMDDQEQDELIDTLRIQNAASSKQQSLALGVALSLSCMLQLTYLFSSSKSSPLFAIAPSKSSDTEPPIPLPNLFSSLSIVIHSNLAIILLRPNKPAFLRDWTHDHNFNVKPLSYAVSLSLSAIAPIVCILYGRSWQTTVWWGFTILVVLVVQIVQTSIVQGDECVRELEKLKYAAPGA